VTTQPDTDAPPTHEHVWTREYAPNYRQASEADDWREECACGETRTGSDAPQEGRPTTPQTEAGRTVLDMLESDSARPFDRDVWATNILDIEREAAAGALPSVDGALLAQYWFEDWSGERFSNLDDQRLWIERGRRVAARLAAAPPEASERCTHIVWNAPQEVGSDGKCVKCRDD
jgi:hypothetical protein